MRHACEHGHATSVHECISAWVNKSHRYVIWLMFLLALAIVGLRQSNRQLDFKGRGATGGPKLAGAVAALPPRNAHLNRGVITRGFAIICTGRAGAQMGPC